MAIAFIRGTLSRDAFFRNGESTPFTALSVKETYKDRDGEEKLAGYHDVVAFGPTAQRLALLKAGDQVDVKANIRYRADKRFQSTIDPDKNPFVAQFVVMEINSMSASDGSMDEDPFA
jgi:single-stranded DNA-binding protein